MLRNVRKTFYSLLFISSNFFVDTFERFPDMLGSLKRSSVTLKWCTPKANSLQGVSLIINLIFIFHCVSSKTVKSLDNKQGYTIIKLTIFFQNLNFRIRKNKMLEYFDLNRDPEFLEKWKLEVLGFLSKRIMIFGSHSLTE